ncbi:MAG: endonuclease/exonuclease/phosphatase family protein [Flavobacteriaceae bacterium]|nr:endonuclease/exonuclease/phosphatase family protein [Flavobacteriaceae bacterium]
MNKFIFIFITCAFLYGQNCWSQTQIDSSKIVKILSFNILHGKTMKGDFDLDVIAKVINDANADFVALQEVDFKTNRAKKYDLVTELGWRTKLAPIYARAMHYDGGEYGEGVLSKHTFLQTRNIALPHLPDDEPRAALEITTVLPSKDTVSFIGTHLDHLKLDTNKVMQAKAINEVFSKNKYPTILAGDLNAEPNSNTMNILESFWTASYDINRVQPTYSSENPTQKIDYVLFYPKHRWKVLKKETICDEIASDHCAYLVTLQLLDE